MSSRVSIIAFAAMVADNAITAGSLPPGAPHALPWPGAYGVYCRRMGARTQRFWATSEQDADAPVWLATAPELKGVTGRFFDHRKEMAPEGVARDAVIAREG